MINLNVELGERSYPILIGPGLVRNDEVINANIPGSQVLIVTNDVVAPLYLQPVRDALADRKAQELILPDGESYKNLEQFEKIMTTLLESEFNRQCVLVALGGGVIGDLVGYAAASYQRGVRFVQIPTTLLAQVDSSVGGKTAVNHPLGKNMIGAFHQPVSVLADVDTLATLPEREFKAGVAEVIKYGLLGDRDFFDWLEINLDALIARDPNILSEAIRRSCQNKADVVAEDEREAGRRALLNLGHTFGHAIETTLGYGKWLHGEAVGAGMCLAADISRRLGYLDDQQVQRVISIIERAGLPSRAPSYTTAERLEAAMRLDKKNRDNAIRLVVMRDIGHAEVTDDYPLEMLRDTLSHNLSQP